jgi:hypothetical protein
MRLVLDASVAVAAARPGRAFARRVTRPGHARPRGARRGGRPGDLSDRGRRRAGPSRRAGGGRVRLRRRVDIRRGRGRDDRPGARAKDPRHGDRVEAPRGGRGVRLAGGAGGGGPLHARQGDDATGRRVLSGDFSLTTSLRDRILGMVVDLPGLEKFSRTVDARPAPAPHSSLLRAVWSAALRSLIQSQASSAPAAPVKGPSLLVPNREDADVIVAYPVEDAVRKSPHVT